MNAVWEGTKTRLTQGSELFSLAWEVYRAGPVPFVTSQKDAFQKCAFQLITQSLQSGASNTSKGFSQDRDRDTLLWNMSDFHSYKQIQRLTPMIITGGWGKISAATEIISHVRPDLFDLVVDDVVDAALGLELRHGRVGGREVEPLRAGLQVSLGGKPEGVQSNRSNLLWGRNI